MLPDLPIALALNGFLPWVLGFALATALIPGGDTARQRLNMAYAYPLGMAALAVLLAVFDLVGIPFQRAALVGTAMITTLLLFLWTWHRNGSGSLPRLTTPAPPSLTLPMIVLSFAAAILLTLMTRDLLLSPTESWDSWMNWEPRARIWFAQGHLAPVVSPSEWLARPPGTEAFVLGNSFAATQPPLVPLIMLWEMIMLRDPNAPVLYLAWPALALSVALAIGLQLRQRGADALAVPLGAFLFLAIPYVGAHITMAGYADLILAIYFTLGVLGIQSWSDTGNRRHLLMTAGMAIAVLMAKRPGIILLPILLGTLAFMVVPPAIQRLLTKLLLAAGVFVLAITALPFIAAAVGLAVPMGDLVVFPAPAIQELALGIYPFLPLALHTVFDASNWGLFWILLGLAAISRRPGTPPRACTLALVMTLIALYGVFGLTHYYREAANTATLNRALLYLIPLGVYLITDRMLQAFRPQRIEDQQ